MSQLDERLPVGRITYPTPASQRACTVCSRAYGRDGIMHLLQDDQERQFYSCATCDFTYPVDASPAEIEAHVREVISALVAVAADRVIGAPRHR